MLTREEIIEDLQSEVNHCENIMSDCEYAIDALEGDECSIRSENEDFYTHKEVKEKWEYLIKLVKNDIDNND